MSFSILMWDFINSVLTDIPGKKTTNKHSIYMQIGKYAPDFLQLFMNNFWSIARYNEPKP